MNNVTDILIVQKGGENGVAISALLTLRQDDQDFQVWVNGGYRTADGRIVIPGKEAAIEFEFTPAGVAKYKAEREAGNPNAHHTIVGKGRLGDVEFVGFPDREGMRIGLKPKTPSDATPFAELA